MTYVFSILGIAAACVLWVAIQRISGSTDSDESSISGTCGFCGRKALGLPCDKGEECQSRDRH
ncbi:hypothetical protein K8I61_16550 [bacterium]|nr:hypothetical protein [bacterium]